MPLFANHIGKKEINMILERLKAIVKEQLGVNVDNVTLASRIKEDVGLDSLDVVEVLMSVEEERDVTFDDDEVADIKTVGDVVQLIQQKL